MARFRFALSVRLALVALAMILVVAAAHAQITNVTDDTSTPIPGVGHDYIHLLSETVNPANGSVSLRIQPPMPKGRGITVPFYIGYDSDSASHLIADEGLPGSAIWASNNAYLSQGGWQYSSPMASVVYSSYVGNPNDLTPTTCWVMTNFMFTDPSGSSHPLNLASAPSVGPSPSECHTGGYLNPGGDGIVYAYLSQLYGGTQNGNDPNFQPLYVYTADGTVYNFQSVGQNGSLPSSIEDRNGNIVAVTDNNNASFTFTDTAGRVAVSSNGMGPSGTTNTLSFSGLSYGVTWETVSASFAVSSTQIDAQSGVSCLPPPARSANLTTVSQITLPNGTFYKFYYGANNPHSGYTNPYGLLSEIDYPDGGWVRYTWKPSDTPNELANYPGEGPTGQSIPNGCLYEYTTPVVATRQVGFGGSSPSSTQAFTYSTTWTPVPANPGNWSQKNTTVCTTDDVRGSSVCTSPTSVPPNAFLTTYSYSSFSVGLNNEWNTSYPPQIPLENVTTLYNWGNTTSVAQTVTKTWYDQYELTGQTTVTGGVSSLITHTYEGPAQPVETDEYDYGATTPSRKTINTYQSFPKTYANMATFPDIVGILSDEPCKTVVTDGNGNTFSETDSYYDGGTALCGTVPAPMTTSVSGLIVTTHDGTNYPPSSSMARGNVTQVARWLNGGTSPATTYTYDETGQLLSMTDPCGQTGVTCADMASGNHTTQYSYADNYSSGTPPGNTNTYLSKATDPLNHITNYTYGYSDGQLTSATDPNSQTTTYKYNIKPSGCSVLDELDRLGEIDYPDEGVTTFCYNDAAYSPSTPSPSVTTTKIVASGVNEVSVSARDGIGHPVETILSSDPDGATYTFTSYDGMSRPYSVTNPYRTTNDPTYGSTTSTYDSLGRTTQVTEPDGSMVSTSYSSKTCGTATEYLTTVTDEVGNQRSSQTDALGRLTCVWEAPNNSSYNFQTAYAYDPLNNLLSVTQTGGSRKRTFTYDSLSRLLCAANPEVQVVTCPVSGTTFPAGAITYSYDSNGNLSSKVAPEPGQTTGTSTVTASYLYDSLNRLTQKSYVGLLTHTVKFGYDGAVLTGCGQDPPNLTGATNLVGRRSGMCAWQSGSSWSFDQMGRRLVESRTNSSSKEYKYNVSYAYNLDGSLKALTYPSGDVVTYTVGGAGRPTNLNDSSNNYVGDSANPLMYPATYAPNGSLASTINGYTTTPAFAGIVTSNIYNDRLQPIWLSAGVTVQGSIFSLCYDFHLGIPVSTANCSFNAYTSGDNGNVFQIVNKVDPTRSTAYVYDPLNRIAQAYTVNLNSANCWGETYSPTATAPGVLPSTPGIDAWGNLTNRAGVSGMGGSCATEGLSQTANSQNQLSGSTYDIAGDVVNDGNGNTPTYDAENRVVTDAGVTYSYDADGFRVEKSSGTMYWPGPSGSLAETGLTGSINEEYIFFNGQRIARVDRPSGTVHYYFSNHLGSASVITDALGNIEQQTDYYPYGGVAYTNGSDPNHYRFTGKDRDSESGFDNFGARYYDYPWGRFMTADDGSDQDAGNPQSWNLYPYVRNNPLSNTDPTGNACVQEGNGGFHDDESPGETCAQVAEANRLALEAAEQADAQEEFNRLYSLIRSRQDAINPEGEKFLAGYATGAIIGKIFGVAWGAVAGLFGRGAEAGGTATGEAAGQLGVRAGGLIDRIFQTSSGPVRVYAEVVAEGQTAVIKDVAIYPAASETGLQVGYTQMRQGLNGVLSDLKAQGFTQVRIEAYRVSGAVPGRTLNLTVTLK